MDGYGYGFGASAPAPARGPSRLVGALVFVAVLALGAGTVLVGAGSARSWYPKSWDPRVAPIAAEVAHLRGLDFTHPVPIVYLEPKAFVRALGSENTLTARDRAEIDREASVYRSLGFIGGKVDLLRAFETAEASSTLAYYDPRRQEIIVRGTTLDVAHRVTIAHEMTHVLQDQHFDIVKLEQRARASEVGDTSTIKALIEGDARRIEQDYVERLTPAEHKEFTREDDAEGTRVRHESASVPPIVGVFAEAPYAWGSATVRVLFGSGGNAAVDDALTGPAPSSGVFVDAGDVSPPVAVDAPLRPAGAVAVGPPDSFGPFETYLTLAMKLDPVRALAAADTVAGGSAVAFRNRTTTCYRVVLEPRFEHSRAFLLHAVQDWARSQPDVTVDTTGALVGFTTCDARSKAPAPPAGPLDRAVDVLSIRSEFAVGVARKHESGEFARCTARMFVQSPGIVQLALAVGNGTPTAAQQDRIRADATASATACRDDLDSGLR